MGFQILHFQGYKVNWEHCNNGFNEKLPEVNQMSKGRDAKKSDKKTPQKTAKEKKKAKQEKKAK